jgi:hypothetical protein
MMAPMLLNTAQVVVNADNVWLAHCGQICVVYPRGETNAQMVADITRGVRVLTKRVPTGVGLLLIIGLGSPAPVGEVRAAALKMFEDFVPDLKLLAAYVEGSGFVAATKRSVLTLLFARLLRRRPVKTFGDLAQATDWLEAQAKRESVECPTSEELQLLVERSNNPNR